MTPEERAKEFYSRAPRYRTKMILEDDFRVAIREAYKDAVRIAAESEVMCEHGCTDRIADLIRSEMLQLEKRQPGSQGST